MNSPKAKTRWWLAATLAPIIPTLAGAVVAFAAPQNQDDWLGMRFILPIGIGLLLGCLLAPIFLVVSYLKNEEKTTHAFWALVLMGFLFALASGRRR